MGVPTLQEELEGLIAQACSEKHKEPDLGLILEICEIIRTKTSLYHHWFTYFVSENEVQCLIALFALDMIVVNCGYPTHLAISKKDFLNKLVYRFPPTSKHQLDRTHEHILHLLQKWCVALCERSTYRADFGNIRLMYSLLKSRGFIFPRVDDSEINALLTHEQIQKTSQSPEDMEREHKTVNEARLEDLLRRGTPADLRAANELMKMEHRYSMAESEILQRIRDLESKLKELDFMMESCPGADATNKAKLDLLGMLPQLQKWATMTTVGMSVGQIFGIIDRITELKEGAASVSKEELIDLMDEGIETGKSSTTSSISSQPSNVVEMKLLTIYYGGNELENNMTVIAQLWSNQEDYLSLCFINFSSNLLENVRVYLSNIEDDNLLVQMPWIRQNSAELMTIANLKSVDFPKEASLIMKSSSHPTIILKPSSHPLVINDNQV